jgi:PAS domain-containing protein
MRAVPIKMVSNLRRYGLATISCAVALAVARPLDAPSSCFLLAVMISSLYGGQGPGLLSVALSSFAFDYFFLSPRGSIYSESSSYLRLAVFVGAALFINQVIEARRRSERASDREKKLVEDELRKNESYLAEAQRLSQTGSFGWNLATKELFWSAETYRILGYEPQIKPTVQLVLERVHPDDRARVEELFHFGSEHGANFDFEHRFLMPDGSVKHMHVLAHAPQWTLPQAGWQTKNGETAKTSIAIWLPWLLTLSI